MKYSIDLVVTTDAQSVPHWPLQKSRTNLWAKRLWAVAVVT